MGASCRFRKFRSLGGIVGKVRCVGACTPEGLPPFRLTPTRTLPHAPEATSIVSEDQDIEFPARLARQRQEPAEHPSRSLGDDGAVAWFFQFPGLDSPGNTQRRKTASTKEAGIVSIRLAALRSIRGASRPHWRDYSTVRPARDRSSRSSRRPAGRPR